jgi:hypothetical protein
MMAAIAGGTSYGAGRLLEAVLHRVATAERLGKPGHVDGMALQRLRHARKPALIVTKCTSCGDIPCSSRTELISRVPMFLGALTPIRACLRSAMAVIREPGQGVQGLIVRLHE